MRPRAVEHLDALCFGRTARVLEAYAAGLHDLDGWLRSLGGTTVPFDPPRAVPRPVSVLAIFPGRPGYPVPPGPGRGPPRRGPVGCPRRRRTRAGHRGALRDQARRLEIDPEGAVTGLCITHAGDQSTLTVLGGVVLACGGFEADPALAEAYPGRPVLAGPTRRAAVAAGRGGASPVPTSTSRRRPTDATGSFRRQAERPP